MSTLGFDFVVVGGGTAGCTLAGRLAERADVTVCLIETGPRNWSPLLKVPGLVFLVSRGGKYLRHDLTEAEPGLGGRRLSWARAAVLGGGSSINGMIHMRGHSSLYNSWNIEGWRFEDLLPIFRAAETSERAPNPWRGSAGPLKVRRGRASVALCEHFLEAVGTAGYKQVDDLNADIREGFGFYDHAIGSGTRSSTADAYLKPRKPNLTIMTGTRVTSLRLDRGRAVGVETVHCRRPMTIWANCEVILTAGALGSAQLLLLSGIGPAAQLRSKGIDVAADVREVGRNLQNHLRYNLTYACRAPVTAYRYRRPFTAIAAAVDYGRSRQGFFAETVISTGGLLRSGLETGSSDIKISVFNALMGTGAGRWGVLPRQEGFAIVVHQGSPYSRGEMELRNNDPTAPPTIRPGNFGDSRDIRVLMRGINQAREILAQPAMTKLGISQIGSGANTPDGPSTEVEIRTNATNIFHEVGTCRMGNDPESVVDPQLRVRGVERLRVADAAIIPILMNANTNASVNMIAEKAAALIMADRE